MKKNKDKLQKTGIKNLFVVPDPNDTILYLRGERWYSWETFIQLSDDERDQLVEVFQGLKAEKGSRDGKTEKGSGDDKVEQGSSDDMAERGSSNDMAEKGSIDNMAEQGSNDDNVENVVVLKEEPRPTVSNAPTGLSVIPGDRTVALTWSAPADGGGTFDHYIIYQDGKASYVTTGTSIVITGLTNGATYEFTVAVNGAAGTGERSSTVSVAPRTVPGAPTGLSAVSDDRLVTLTWTAPIDDGGAGIDHYVVYQDDIPLADRITVLSLNISGPVDGRDHRYAIAAHNSVGIGPRSLPIVIPAAVKKPMEPTSVTAHKIDSGIVIEWNEPTDDGHPIISYSIYRATAAGAFVPLEKLDPASLSYIDRSVAPGSSYSYHLVATNDVGDSGPSAATPSLTVYSLIEITMASELGISSKGIVITLTGQVSTAFTGQSIPGLDIALAYSIDEGTTWVDLQSMTTAKDGTFSKRWVPPAVGAYTMRASWIGNDLYPVTESRCRIVIKPSSNDDGPPNGPI
ncbi:MAG: fibronectin type III domain-containing protein [Methanomassiliicoccales archaeon]|nr:fibronectin type III domain-containing protein [Methanomassiliicoccales archaeon]